MEEMGERPTDNGRNDFLRNFLTQSSESRVGSVLAGDCHKLLLSRFFIDTLYFSRLIYDNHEEIQ